MRSIGPAVTREQCPAFLRNSEKALKVYIQIGRFLAHAIPWYNEFYDYENMMILGRVTSGLGGSVILETPQANLALEPENHLLKCTHFLCRYS